MKIKGLPVIEVDESEEITVAVRAGFARGQHSRSILPNGPGSIKFLATIAEDTDVVI